MITAVKRKYELLMLRNWNKRLTGKKLAHVYLRVDIPFAWYAVFPVPVFTVRGPATAVPVVVVPQVNIKN
jgi:hypothetical protein